MMTAEQPAVPAPVHPLHALTTYELSGRRRELEQAISGISAHAPVQADLRRALDAVLAEQASRQRLSRDCR